MLYHITKNGEKSGPFEKEEVYRRLVAGVLTGSDLGWHEGMVEWEPLSKLLPPPQPSPVPPAPASNAVAAAPPQTSGWAIVSLICGIMVIFSLGITGLFAVITGHMGLSRIKKSAGQLKGRGMAVAGLILGYPGLLFACVFLVGMFAMSPVTKMMMQDQQARWLINARQIVLGARQYAAAHDGKYPPDLEALAAAHLLADPKILEFSPHLQASGQGWDYRGAGLSLSSAPKAVIVTTRKPNHSHKIIVGYNDGSVEAVSESEAP